MVTAAAWVAWLGLPWAWRGLRWWVRHEASSVGGLGALQDLGVALVGLALLGAWPPWAAALVTVMVLADVWLDHALFALVQMRLEPGLARSLGHPGSLLSSATGSAVQVGFGLLAAGALGLMMSQGRPPQLGPPGAVFGGLLVVGTRLWAGPRVLIDHVLVRQLTGGQGRWLSTVARRAGALAMRDVPAEGSGGVPAERPHVVVVLLESFEARRGTGHTPRFDALVAQGWWAPTCYATGVQTARALISLLFSRSPRLTAGPVQADRRPPALDGLPQHLAAAGWHTAWWHAGDLAFQRQGRFWSKHFDEVRGRDDLLADHPDAVGNSWGLHDAWLFRDALDRLAVLDAADQPTFAVLKTVTHHHPWHAPEGPTRGPALERLQATQRYSDACLGDFIDGLDAAGLRDRTLVVLVGDQGQPTGQRSGNWHTAGQLHEEGQRVPLLILRPGTREGRVLEALCSQLDVAPTVLELIGLAPLAGAEGCSLCDRRPEDPVWYGNPFLGGWLGLRAGRWAVLLDPSSTRPKLYDLEEDPAQLRDLAPAQPERADALAEECLVRHAASEARWAAASPE